MPATVHLTRAVTVDRFTYLLISDADRVPLLLTWAEVDGDDAPIVDGDPADVLLDLVDVCRENPDMTEALVAAHSDTIGGFAADPRALLGPHPGPERLNGLLEVLLAAEEELADVVDMLEPGQDRTRTQAVLDLTGGLLGALERYWTRLDDLYNRNAVLYEALSVIETDPDGAALWRTACQLLDTFLDGWPTDRTLTVVAGGDQHICELFIPAGSGGAADIGDTALFLGLTGWGLASGGGLVVRAHRGEAEDEVSGYVLTGKDAHPVAADVLAAHFAGAGQTCATARPVPDIAA